MRLFPYFFLFPKTIVLANVPELIARPNLTSRFEQMAHCYVGTRRALECYDILATIFSENVSIPFIGTTTLFRNSDLVKLARVCRGWCAHALRLLWRELPSTYPLWHLLAPPGLPSPTGSAPTAEYCDAVISARLYADAERLSSFLWYCGHVRTLETRHSTDAVLVHTLLEVTGGRPLFPSLATLRWGPSSTSDLSVLPLFTHTLRKVNVIIYHKTFEPIPDVDESVVWSIVGRLQDSSPKLQDLFIYVSLQSPPSTALMRHLASFSHLQRLQTTISISSSALLRLMSNGCLVRADTQSVVWDGPPSKVASHSIPAHALEVLKIAGDSTSLAKLFTAIHAPKLNYAFITASNSGAVAESHCVSYVAALAAAVRCDVFNSLHLECSGLRPTTPMDLANLVEPLLPFRELTYFNYTSDPPDVFANDSTCGTITRAWPNLKHFTINMSLWSVAGEHPEMPTATVLYSFWRHCPRLRHLSLPHLQFQDQLVDVDEYRPSTHPLEQLQIDITQSWSTGKANLPAGVVEEHARYASGLFPCLNKGLPRRGLEAFGGERSDGDPDDSEDDVGFEVELRDGDGNEDDEDWDDVDDWEDA
ncbi:hypothetical protein C8Q76DRAFT_802194 [Earliella scabrosa]|nr:hypothetical protein C8Q76DRAFT_802194 [Earliella scabrosa]